jgi:hypothetical protein
MASSNVPEEREDDMCRCTEAAPALSPNIVMEAGFPPNAPMFCLVHLSAAAWSFRPMLPRSDSVSRLKNPNIYISLG